MTAGAGALLLAACGKSLTTLSEEAMDGCIAARNPAFTSGKGVSALDTPLPKTISELADHLAYDRAFRKFQAIADAARDQVTLVCALELSSHYRHGDVGVFLYRFTRHPDAGVADNARRLLRLTQDPVPGGVLR